MKWLSVAAPLLVVALRPLAHALFGALTLLLVDVGLLDAQIGRSVDHAFRPSALSLTLAQPPAQRWVPRAW